MSSYCLLTGGICGHSPIQLNNNSFFVAEPYDADRTFRESSIQNALMGYKLFIADNDVLNIAITCKICHMIQSCEFGIADISGLNSNVLIELGMLYGFNKPTIILVKREQAPDFKIPSNIIGLEQIRYTEYSELESMLKVIAPKLFQITKRTEEVILDFYPLLRDTIEVLDLVIFIKQKGPIVGKILEVKGFDGFSNLIINRGKEHGVTQNMIFDLFILEPSVKEEDIEYFIGSIQPINIQKGLSQYIVYEQRIAHPFWDGLIQNQEVISKHVIKSQIPSIFKSSSIVELMEMREKYNEILQSIQVVSGYVKQWKNI